MKCCFCGKELKNIIEMNDPRPIITNHDDVCCDYCNQNIVVPTREKIWGNENELYLQISELKGELEQYEKHETHNCNSIDELIKNCDECELCECIGCEHSSLLAQEVKQLKTENERLKTKNSELDHFYTKVVNGNLELKGRTSELCEKIQEYKQQLNEKDDEIEKLNKQIGALQKDSIRKDNIILMKDKEIVNIKSELAHKKYLLKFNTHQVCEKIKSNIGTFDTGVHFNRVGFIKWLEEILNQTKGEINEEDK